MTLRKLSVTLAVAGLVLPASAAAHVTVQPSTAPAGGFTRLDVRVPNERDDKGTVKVDLKLPPGFITASYEPVPGWTVNVTKEKLDKPVKVEGFDVTEQVGRITWTGHGKDGVIPPGAFQDFGLSVAMPKGKAGEKLTFKALQTYQGGEVVRWIGPEGSDEPAPTVTLTEATEGGGHGAPGTTADEGEGGGGTTSAPAAADEGSSDALAIAALVVGGLGLLAGIGGLFAARRARSAA